MSNAEKKAWGILNTLNPSDICRKANVFYENQDDTYLVKSFGMDFHISVRRQEINCIEPAGESLLKKYSYFLNLSFLYYLINAKDIPLSGRPVKPENIQGGAIFFRGTHILPLDHLAAKYGSDRTEFIEKGKSFGGRVLHYNDASIELFPMPRIPVTLILWLSDDEFPARADLLFDSTCEMHVPIDILWSVAMLSVLVML